MTFEDAGALDVDGVETVLAEAIGRACEGRRCCFALSGGVDSTVLTVVAAARGIGSHIVAYTADSGFGRDLSFARAAATRLGVEHRVVPIPTGAQAVRRHVALSLRAGEAIDLVGNAFCFAVLCEAARADGFDAIIDGTGAEQISCGNERLTPVYLRAARAAGRPDWAEACLSRLPAGERPRAEAAAATEGPADCAAAMMADLEHPLFLNWLGHHRANAAASGLEIRTPFLDPAARIFTRQPLSFYYPNGWRKGAFRAVLARHVGDEIAYRRDNQGLRWKARRALAGGASEMDRVIRRSGVLAQTDLGSRMLIRLGVAPFSLRKRLYSRALAHLAARDNPRN